MQKKWVAESNVHTNSFNAILSNVSYITFRVVQYSRTWGLNIPKNLEKSHKHWQLYTIFYQRLISIILYQDATDWKFNKIRCITFLVCRTQTIIQTLKKTDIFQKVSNFAEGKAKFVKSSKPQDWNFYKNNNFTTYFWNICSTL